ncbi:ParB/RepB/Spo0J family partition protein [Streptomyces europaeiscabiei]|uniref:ParB/RepB/Spo0J family partition protein n=1 Tax=Streptomyces europaeiscabiei TaxID=146819 RepID=UPI0029A668CF|nr:ParB/RepB/Spo0J family partition protein [Streptomyces europaeiscabiei]MDX3584204.1 ParB/RepB/Spo0J family partition protein [Streptomyces europaeiscabiei]
MNPTCNIPGSLTTLSAPLEKPDAVVAVPVDLLVIGDTLRLKGPDKDHVNVLAQFEGQLPPILVHGHSMRVVDGLHRLAAAKLLGQATIDVRFFEGDAEEAFVEAVRANSAHGLPLTLADRRAAAIRIIRAHPEWSDRMTAGLVGLSPKTVGAARKRLTEEFPQSTARIGRDGRVRRVPARGAACETRSMPGGDEAEAGVPSRVAAPDAPLRDIGEEAGVAISTVHRMRQGLRSGAATIAPAVAEAAPSAVATPQQGLRLASASKPSGLPAHATVREPARAIDILSKDPSIRFTDSGRSLMRWLNGQAQGLATGERLMAAVPPHCAQVVAEVAGHYAKEWERLTVALQQNDSTNGSRRQAQ